MLNCLSFCVIKNPKFLEIEKVAFEGFNCMSSKKVDSLVVEGFAV